MPRVLRMCEMGWVCTTLPYTIYYARACNRILYIIRICRVYCFVFFQAYCQQKYSPMLSSSHLFIFAPECIFLVFFYTFIITFTRMYLIQMTFLFKLFTLCISRLNIFHEANLESAVRFKTSRSPYNSSQRHMWHTHTQPSSKDEYQKIFPNWKTLSFFVAFFTSRQNKHMEIEGIYNMLSAFMSFLATLLCLSAYACDIWFFRLF